MFACGGKNDAEGILCAIASNQVPMCLTSPRGIRGLMHNVRCIMYIERLVDTRWVVIYALRLVQGIACGGDLILGEKDEFSAEEWGGLTK